MRELNIFQNSTSRHFTNNEEDIKSIQCAYISNRECTPDCASCEINQEDTIKTATCLRGSFTFGEITSSFGEDY